MAKKLWGGRFSKPTDPLVEKFTRSIQYDHKLAECDVLGSIAHITILKKAGLLTLPQVSRLINGLRDILKNIYKNNYKPDMAAEDVHSDIQNKLQHAVGDIVLKMHTARSRNDQVAFAAKLYCKLVLQKSILVELDTLKSTLLACGTRHKQLIIPGFTHLQHAQPVYLKDFFNAYAIMLKRDLERLGTISRNIHLTLGAGALAGTPLQAATYTLKASEFMQGYSVASDFDIKATANSLDSVSDRDFVIEIISALAILAMHLSRLAEDLILWSTKEFDFVELDDAFCTGSSLMPQKKNPDVLELIRGYAGRLNGNLVSVLTMMKGLPLTYNRDMQLDKEPLFNSFEIVSGELEVLTGLVKTLKFKKDTIEAHLKDESLYATDLVYYLVDKKVPFKQAHTIVGKLVQYSLTQKIDIKAMPEDVLKGFSGAFVRKEIVKLFNPLVSVRSKKSILRNK
jgi:argininosuccinate lyase